MFWFLLLDFFSVLFTWSKLGNLEDMRAVIIKCVSSERSANVNWIFAAIFIALGISPWGCAGRRNHSWPCTCAMVQKPLCISQLSCSPSSSSLPLCFQYHNLAAKPFSLCAFCGVFHPLQGAVKSQLWGSFITSAVKIFEAGGISSPTALKEGDTHRGQFNSLTLSKINNHPPGIFWYFCYLHTLYLEAEQTPNREQWWHLCCGEFS